MEKKECGIAKDYVICEVSVLLVVLCGSCQCKSLIVVLEERVRA